MVKQFSSFLAQKDHAGKLAAVRLASFGVAVVVVVGLIVSIGSYKPASAAGPFTVNTLNDTHDANTGDVLCADAAAKCSLRAALEQASASGGATTINLPAGTYNLSLGDLIAGTQANTNITIHGAGSAATIIHQTQAGRMVIVVNPHPAANVIFALDNVTVSGGSENENDPDGFGGNGGAIQAGGSATTAGDNVTITNVVFSGNYCSPVTNAGCSGGAINMTGGGNLTVSGSVFTGNEAAKNAGTGFGGAIYFDNDGNPGNVSITNSNFTDNIAHNTGGQGGAVRLAGGIDANFIINNNTFIGNNAAQNGGALYLSTGSLTANFNRILGNISTSGSGIFVADNSGSIGTATNNWWGCNGGPGATGCDTSVLGPGGGGSMTFNPWIVFKIAASPNPILVGQSTTLTADFLHNSANTVLTTAQISRLIGVSVSWGSAVRGTLSSTQTTIQANGKATAAFTANTVGAGSATAKADNGPATAAITINKRYTYLPIIQNN